MSNEYIYTDITPEMEISWDRDINFSIDALAVKNSIKGILMTRKRTRPFFPDFGTDLPTAFFFVLALFFFPIFSIETKL